MIQSLTRGTRSGAPKRPGPGLPRPTLGTLALGAEFCLPCSCSEAIFQVILNRHTQKLTLQMSFNHPNLLTKKKEGKTKTKKRVTLVQKCITTQTISCLNLLTVLVRKKDQNKAKTNRERNRSWVHTHFCEAGRANVKDYSASPILVYTGITLLQRRCSVRSLGWSQRLCFQQSPKQCLAAVPGTHFQGKDTHTQ